ncbi:TonB-dependent receptor [Echinimonas agarilytica]|uniref:TonB-dependent receptor n=1 Tax=Echinimonas agarilytica TaxID=1215918 RepID=A0AA41W4C2_9GAMM|nr:TonB-dependent receptor [Echinimonas agarilytica]MCM2678374.1 TonB-dependent receptor [Echinimonas agarilytica]
MKNLTFKKTRLTLAISLLLGSGAAAPAFAQEQALAEKDLEIIQVKGIRGSYMRASDMKRENFGVVDGISAEDIGKFPDTNLAESLGRITGISVSRTNGEGSEITARGFGPEFNLVTLNGRQMPGTGNTRSYDLSNLSPEGVNALEVYKTARAELPSGGLGATVNIVTSKPFGAPGQQFSVMAKGIHDSSVETGDDITPEVSAMYSNTFMDETFGIGLTFSDQRRDFRQQTANIQGWQANVDLPDLDAASVVDPRTIDADGNRVGNHFFPKDMNYSIRDVERTKTNGQVVLQYAPFDSLVATIDYTMTKSSTAEEESGWGIWNDFGSNINAYELDANGTAIYADISGNDGSFTASKSTTEVEAKSLGFNLDWAINDEYSLAFDYHDSSNEVDNGADSQLGGYGQVILGSDQLDSKIYDYRTGEIPHAQIYWSNGTTELAPGEIDSNFSQFIHSPGESTIEQFQLDGSWTGDLSVGLIRVDVGAAYTDQEMSGWTAWSGLRGGPGFNPSFTSVFPDVMFTRQSTSGLLDAFSGGGSSLQPNYYYTFDFDEAVARQQAMLTEDLLGDNYYAVDPYFDGIDSQQSVQEETSSVYLQTAWEWELGDYILSMNAGARYEQTDVTSVVRQAVPEEVQWAGASEWIMVNEQGGDDNFATFEGDHSVFLPMIDLKLDITDDLVARASWGKSISRAPLSNLAGGRSLTGSPKVGARSGSEGNTNLQPFKSNNIDLSIEYYYEEGSYASVGYFKKKVDNFIATEIVKKEIDGLHDIYEGPRYNQAVADIEARGDQATSTAIFDQMKSNLGLGELDPIRPTSDDPLIVWDISRPFNSDTKTVDGFEIAVQHFFGDSGFGFGANATFVDGDVDFDTESLEQQAPLVGISDSANLQLFYEKHGLSVKTTYSWRDDYLIGVGQDQGSSDAPPQYAKEFGQLDLSVNYDINEDFTVFFEGINLNDETEQGYGRYEEQFLFARQYGPRYAIGARYSFK